MLKLISFMLLCLVVQANLSTAKQSIPSRKNDLPVVPEGFVVDVIAREPLVSNPCVMAFDRRGRLLVAQGPQWRAAPQSVGDRVDILIDENGDGVADRAKTFARGFNSIQGLAWHGDDLWIANAPDLTVVRDMDGDDKADQYIRVYTGLGNLEHSLHGLNFGPDGKLYMSKGNSKGYNRLDQLAPKAFRELWGLKSPEGAPDYTPIEYFSESDYRRNQHTPADDWGQQGGILRCQPYAGNQVSGRELEIIARGFRNPWDIAFDDGFNWLGTDNDQSTGDRIFMPFTNAHFGWGHPWSFDWTGQNHLPTVPNSAPTFEGSGTGVTYYYAEQFPPEYRNLFFIGDWLRREVLMFRPRWEGALMVAESGTPDVFAHAEGGRTLPSSDGRAFDPTDLEVGPDGALYVLSWGHEYGGEINNGVQTNVGRVYRIRYQQNDLISWQNKRRLMPISQWSLEDLWSDLGASVPGWRVNAQNEFIRRADEAAIFIQNKLKDEPSTRRAHKTWGIWTLARMSKLSPELFRRPDQDTLVQLIRGLAFQDRQQPSENKTADLVSMLDKSLDSVSERVRFEAVQAIAFGNHRSLSDQLVGRLKSEKDRIVFYALWNAIRKVCNHDERLAMLSQQTGGARLGLLLGLLEEDGLIADDVKKFRNDTDSRVRDLIEQWLLKTGAEKPLLVLHPEPGTYQEQVSVAIKSSAPGGRITYTLDGSVPGATSMPYRGPISMTSDTQLKVALIKENTIAGRVVTAAYRIVDAPEYQGLRFVNQISTPSGRFYEMDYRGLSLGKRVYTDRNYALTAIPDSLTGLPFIRAANNDDRSQGNRWLTFHLEDDADVLVGVDTRNNAPLAWMKIGTANGFSDTGQVLETDDADFRFYRKSFRKGPVVLGGNTNDPNDSGRGNYLVVFERKILQPGKEAATLEQVLAAMPTASPTRGRELFMHPRGAGCVKCHLMQGEGKAYAPDLSDLGNRAKTPKAIVESILDPGAVITEGFAQQVIETIDGRLYRGAVIEESGRTLKLVDSDGRAQNVNVADIENRKGTKLSPMPSGFGKSMSAQQVADVVAWLLTQKVVGNPGGFSFREQGNRIEVFWAKQRIATYLKNHPKLTRRALVNVKTPGGIQVTRNFPPRKPDDLDPGYRNEDGIIHPVMHPGIWISFGDVDGNDFWRLKAKVEYQKLLQPLKGDLQFGSFAVLNHLMSEDGKRVVCKEETQYQFQKVSAGVKILIKAKYYSDDADFYFGDQEESGLAIRVASPIRVTGGTGEILNDRGEKNGVKVRGTKSRWFDYSGTVMGRHVGLIVASAPGNPQSTWLHARDYGVVATNPFPMQPRERREPYVKTRVKRGEAFELGYAILIYETEKGRRLDRQQAGRDLLKSFDKTPKAK